MPRVAILTSGGIAPCLSAAIGGLIEKYNEMSPNAEIIGYMHGYRGLCVVRVVRATDLERIGILRKIAENHWTSATVPCRIIE